jgi:signal peptidase I
MGKALGGFSQTVNADLTAADFERAKTYGISYIAHAQLPPGTYQLRAVVRETETGRLGSMSQYLEVPDISKKNLTASSIFLYAVKMDQGANAAPQPLTALRQLPRQQDLRYAAVVYFPKVSDGKVQLTSQVIVSRGDKVVFQEPEQPVTGPLQDGQLVKIGQLGLGKAQPGRYVLTLLLKEPGKKEKGIVRSVDFNLVE